MERIQQDQKPNDGHDHIGLPIEEEVRAIVAREKRQGNSIRGMHRQMTKSARIAFSLSHLFMRYGIEAEGDTKDTITI